MQEDPKPPKPRRRGYSWTALGDGRWIKHRPRDHWWSRRGTITIADLGPFDMTQLIARRMTTHELHYYPHVRTGDRPGHAIALAEIRRREGWTARLALVLSFVSLVVAVVNAIVKS
jgi:hypothetical protein